MRGVPSLSARSPPAVTFGFVVVLLLVVGTSPPAEAAGGGSSPAAPRDGTPIGASSRHHTPDAHRVALASPEATTSPLAAATTTATTTATETATETNDTETGASLVVTSLTAPERVRPGDSFSATASVTNWGDASSTEPLTYTFDGAAIRARNVTVAAGESRNVTFDLAVSALDSDAESVPPGTYVHGVRNASGDGVARYLRVTPDVDVAVDGFDAPTEIARDRAFVVLASVSNPGDVTVTRELAYRFDGTAIATKTVTVGAGESEPVAFAANASRIERAGVALDEGTTYDHAVVAAGGRRDGDAVRLVRGPTADSAALVTANFDAPDDVRRGETDAVAVTVRNVDTVAFDGRLTYRVDGAVVAVDSASIPAGERATIRFRVDYDAVSDAVAPLDTPRTDQSVRVANETLVTRPVTVHDAARTATPTPTPAPTFEDRPTATPGPGTSVPSPANATATPTCSRGFFTRCGGTALDQTTLTVVGTVTSVLGILFELFKGE